MDRSALVQDADHLGQRQAYRDAAGLPDRPLLRIDLQRDPRKLLKPLLFRRPGLDRHQPVWQLFGPVAHPVGDLRDHRQLGSGPTDGQHQNHPGQGPALPDFVRPAAGRGHHHAVRGAQTGRACHADGMDRRQLQFVLLGGLPALRTPRWWRCPPAVPTIAACCPPSPTPPAWRPWASVPASWCPCCCKTSCLCPTPMVPSTPMPATPTGGWSW